MEMGTAHGLARLLPPPPESITLHVDLATVTRVRVTRAGGRTIEAGCVRGWAVGPEPLARVDVIVGGNCVATARLGLDRPDVAELFPGLSHAASAGFEVLLTTGTLPSGAPAFQLKLHTVSGHALSVVHPLAIFAPTPASHDATPIRMAVDRCVVDDECRLQLSGWALARGRVAAVQVFADSEHLATLLPDLERADVAHLFPGLAESGRSGFSLTRQLPPNLAAATAIRVEVIARDGATRAMQMPLAREHSHAAARMIAPHARSLAPALPLQFHCDRISLTRDGALRVEGWALAPPGIAAIAIALDGQDLGLARLGLSRPDVARTYPSVRDGGKAGFAFESAVAAPTDKEHQLRVVVTLNDGTRHSFAEWVAPEPDGPLTQDSAGDVMLAVDGMQIAAGRAGRKITGPFHLVGWAIARTAVARVEVFLDGLSLGFAYHGLRREDVAAAFPAYPEALRSGFALSVPRRALKNGPAELRVCATARDGSQDETRFSVEVDLAGHAAAATRLRLRILPAEERLYRAVLQARGGLPACELALVVPAGRRAAPLARATLESLASQGYERWRIWLLPKNGADGSSLLEELRGTFPEQATKIDLVQHFTPANDHALIGLLRAGDVIAADAFYALALAATGPDAPDLVYGDDIRPDAATGRMEAFLKPGWSPDLLLSQNYIGRAWLARNELLARAGLDLRSLATHGAYDALLRLTERANAIRHVPRVLIESRGFGEPASTERRALARSLRRRGLAGIVEPGLVRGLHRIRRSVEPRHKVSIVIPSIAAKGHVRTCIESIRRLTEGIPYEIIIVDNLGNRGLTAQQRAWKRWFRAAADIVVTDDGGFNWSRLNNRGAAAGSGDLLLFLNDDIEVIGSDWLADLASEATRPEVGVVGPQMLYPDGKVQHAGMALTRAEPGRAQHLFRFAEADDPGYFGLALSQREVSCVTGACMMMRRETFLEAGGFDEAHGVVNNDVDFCLRQHAAGRRIIYSPHVRLTHHELASRAGLKDDYDSTAFLARWGELCREGDPFLNRNLGDDIQPLAPDEEPLREVYAGAFIGARDRVRRILAIKLDHIGDLVTALPAVRRLKSHFPQAQLDLLAAPSSLAIAALEPAIDEVLPFAFFEARSGLGRKALRKHELDRLEAQLRARRYDLAVDLRKLGETRHLLRLSNAPVVAGFDNEHAFPWLDIALEWEGDALQKAKRSHVAQDLLNLADAVGNAFADDPLTIDASATAPPLPALLQDFPELLAQDYVVIHPAAGSALRQWPAAHFAALVDLLVERDAVRIVLIGGPDEREIADGVLELVRHGEAVLNLVGRSRLAQLPAILANSRLFVGNNSGPSHIAAGLGVPTIAVHSAIVASEEWGPLGPAALALRRDMSCAPCYIVDVEQCHRGMACLTTITPGAVHEVCRQLLSLRGRHAAG